MHAVRTLQSVQECAGIQRKSAVEALIKFTKIFINQICSHMLWSRHATGVLLAKAFVAGKPCEVLHSIICPFRDEILTQVLVTICEAKV